VEIAAAAAILDGRGARGGVPGLRGFSACRRYQITGLNRWIKPMKFGISVAIYLASLAWYWPVAVASSKAKRWAAGVLA